MVSRDELVANFRTTIETLAQTRRQAEAGRGRVARLLQSKNRDATHFFAPGHELPRSKVGLSSEHNWGMVSGPHTIEGYLGRLSIESIPRQPEILIRGWTLDKSHGDIYVVRMIKDVVELELAVAWARSPELHQAALEQLGRLGKEEREALHENQVKIERASVLASQDAALFGGAGILYMP
jgi:hypothetical protein